jgi:hypothetical protein
MIYPLAIASLMTYGQKSIHFLWKWPITVNHFLLFLPWMNKNHKLLLVTSSHIYQFNVLLENWMDGIEGGGGGVVDCREWSPLPPLHPLFCSENWSRVGGQRKLLMGWPSCPFARWWWWLVDRMEWNGWAMWPFDWLAGRNNANKLAKGCAAHSMADNLQSVQSNFQFNSIKNAFIPFDFDHQKWIPHFTCINLINLSNLISHQCNTNPHNAFIEQSDARFYNALGHKAFSLNLMPNESVEWNLSNFIEKIDRFNIHWIRAKKQVENRITHIFKITEINEKRFIQTWLYKFYNIMANWRPA